MRIEVEKKIQKGGNESWIIREYDTESLPVILKTTEKKKGKKVVGKIHEYKTDADGNIVREDREVLVNIDIVYEDPKIPLTIDQRIERIENRLGTIKV